MAQKSLDRITKHTDRTPWLESTILFFKKTGKSAFRKPLLSFPSSVSWPGYLGVSSTMAASSALRVSKARTAAAAPTPPWPISFRNPCALVLVNDAASPRLLVGVASSDSFRDGIQVHTTCRWFPPSFSGEGLLQLFPCDLSLSFSCFPSVGFRARTLTRRRSEWRSQRNWWSLWLTRK